MEKLKKDKVEILGSHRKGNLYRAIVYVDKETSACVATIKLYATKSTVYAHLVIGYRGYYNEASGKAGGCGYDKGAAAIGMCAAQLIDGITPRYAYHMEIDYMQFALESALDVQLNAITINE